MFVVHPDTKLLQEVTFQVTSHEGGVIVSCATSIELGLTHPHTNLDEVPEEGSLIYSIADMSKNQTNKNCKATICENRDSKSQVRRCYDKSCQEDKNSVMCSVTKEENIGVWLPQPAIKSIYSDKNCQSTRCYKK